MSSVAEATRLRPIAPQLVKRSTRLSWLRELLVLKELARLVKARLPVGEKGSLVTIDYVLAQVEQGRHVIGHVWCPCAHVST